MIPIISMAKPTILIVDDEDQFRESLSEALNIEFHVLTASGVKEGLAVINNNPSSLSLILLDLQMPILTGVDLLESLRSRNNDTPVFILTGNSSQEWAEKCADFNVQGYIKKPVDVVSLICRIKKVLGIEDFEVLQELWSGEYESKKELITPTTIKALCYIGQNCRNNIDREKIAAYAGITPQHLSKKFHKETGLNLMEYVKFFRINKSKDLLKSGDRKLSDISALVGIDDVGYYCKLFKEYTGLSPTEYRNHPNHSPMRLMSGTLNIVK